MRASVARPRQVAGLRFLPKLGRKGPAQLHLSPSLVDGGTAPHWHVWGDTEYTGATNTSRSLRPTASHKTSGLTQMGAEDPRGSVGSPAYSNVITCPVSWAEYFCRT